jgi:uncharacterized membrane protein
VAKSTSPSINRIIPWILVIGGLIGLLAAFMLSLDKIALLSNPDYQPSCNINPIFSCGSIIKTQQASLLGFPNPFLGLVGYSVVITIGMGLFAGAKFKRWFWLGLNGVSAVAVIFIHWLIFQSLYTIGALCLFCMFAWTVTVPIWWYTTLYNLQNGNIKTPKKLQKFVAFISRHHLDIIVSWYILIIALILQNFWYFWSTLI